MYTLANIAFGKFIFPLTSCEPGENDEPTTNYWRCVKIVGEIGKFSCERGKEQKFRPTLYPLSCEHALCLSKKPTGDGSQRTVHKPRTNYKMFASVFEACIRQRALKLLHSGEKREKASWTKRGMSLILLTYRIIFIPLFVHYYYHGFQLDRWLSHRY